ncbi:unnamed protein product [Echinostoma caproni]|uniref:Integrase catalytic domain-containing protein n=1 Tax=Echinostoma caproni TaxID=27848 RepID=A0A183B376_9TREM|nr:unnamed protein product [Echinostoma caproni]
MLINFLYSKTDVSEALLVSDRNIGSSWFYLTLRYSVGSQSDSEFALFDLDFYSEYYNWRRAMEIPAIEQLNFHGSSSEIENATETKAWLDSIGYRHLRTVRRHPCSNDQAENLVKTVKSALASANPKSIADLEAFLDNFLLQYRNATHATTKESLARLFKSRYLRSSLRCMDSTGVT